MKKFKGLLVFVLLFVSMFFINSIKSFAEEVQYTENVTPAMTSNTSPSGTVSASNVLGDGSKYPAWKAFDHDASTLNNAWITSGKTGWLEYDFDDAKCITKYTIISRNTTYGMAETPKSWTFEAYDEQLQQWVILDTQSNISDWKLLVKKEFTFNNTKYYNNYRINITANNGQSYTAIGEIEMMEKGLIVASPTNLKATVKNSQVILLWDDVHAESYNIKRFTTLGDSPKTIDTVTGSAISYIDTNVKPDTTYYYVVSAIIKGVESPNSNVISIEVIPTVNVLKVVLEVDEQLQLSVDDDLDVNTELTWTSSDDTVATVDGNGVVAALTPGNTIITVTSDDGSYTDYINVLVVEKADDYRLAVDLKVGKYCRLTVDDLTDTVGVTWKSSDTSVATISSKGKVTAVGEGLTLIKASDDEGNIIGQVYVRVRE